LTQQGVSAIIIKESVESPHSQYDEGMKMTPVRSGPADRNAEMSFSSYYNRLISRGKHGTPTAEEARRDFSAMLAQSMWHF
jgi:hypothetical protein